MRIGGRSRGDRREGGRDALEAVPGIGPAIAGAVAEMLATGRWAFLDHLKGAADPETLFQAVPEVGPPIGSACL